MFLKQALEALVAAAQHPLALGMYVVVVVAWLVLSLRVTRHRALLRHLEALPEGDRLIALELEMGPLPKKGITAEQWLRGRAQVFSVVRWLVVAVTLIVVLSLAVFAYLGASPKSLAIGGRITVDGAPLSELGRVTPRYPVYETFVGGLTLSEDDSVLLRKKP